MYLEKLYKLSALSHSLITSPLGEGWVRLEEVRRRDLIPRKIKKTLYYPNYLMFLLYKNITLENSYPRKLLTIYNLLSTNHNTRTQK
jgi:hypothetical protein